MRASGILLPVASLPSRYGIGCVSKNMIWNYNLTMMALAPLEAVQSRANRSSELVDNLLPSLVQMGVSELASGVEKATRGIRSAVLW